MLQAQYFIIALLAAIIFLLSKQVKQQVVQKAGKPQLILRHSPFQYSHLNYYPFYNPMGSFRRHHRFHAPKLRHH